METERQKKARRQFEMAAEKRFVKYLDKALEACYEARIENRGCVLTMPIKDLYHYITTETNIGLDTRTK